MNTKVLMTVTSGVLGLSGLSLLFAPELLLAALRTQGGAPLPVVVQLLAALYLAFAMMNWTAKASAIGGIYNRPLALGNFAHFFVGTAVLTRALLAHRPPGFLVLAALVYASLTGLFAWLLFKHSGLSTAPSHAGSDSKGGRHAPRKE